MARYAIKQALADPIKTVLRLILCACELKPHIGKFQLLSLAWSNLSLSLKRVLRNTTRAFATNARRVIATSHLIAIAILSLALAAPLSVNGLTCVVSDEVSGPDVIALVAQIRIGYELPRKRHLFPFTVVISLGP